MNKQEIEKAINVMKQHKCEEIALYRDEYDLAILALERMLKTETVIDAIWKISSDQFVCTYGDHELVNSVKDACCEIIEEILGKQQ